MPDASAVAPLTALATSSSSNGAPSPLRFDSQEPISSPKDLLDRLQALFRLGDLLEEAYQRRDVDQCVKLAREYRAAAESYAKVAGWMAEGAASNIAIDQRKQTIALYGQLSEGVLRGLADGQITLDDVLRTAEKQAALPAATIDA